MFDIFFISLGIIFLGIHTIYSGELGGQNAVFNIEPVKWSSGIILIALGGYCFFLSVKRLIQKREDAKAGKKEQKPLVCPVCASHFYKDETETMKCPDCNEPLIPLSEFIENKEYRKKDDVSK